MSQGPAWTGLLAMSQASSSDLRAAALTARMKALRTPQASSSAMPHDGRPCQQQTRHHSSHMHGADFGVCCPVPKPAQLIAERRVTAKKAKLEWHVRCLHFTPCKTLEFDSSTESAWCQKMIVAQKTCTASDDDLWRNQAGKYVKSILR